MAFTLLSPPTFLSPHCHHLSLRSHHRHVPFKLLRHPSFRRLPPIGSRGMYNTYTSDEDQPESPEDSTHGVEKFQKTHRKDARASKSQEVGCADASDLTVTEYGDRIVEPIFKMSLAELLDESKVVPLSVYGDLQVEITGIQQDSRLVNAGDLFVCCIRETMDEYMYPNEAYKRGAVAFIASKETGVEDILGYKALVIVEDTNLIMPVLAASFYRYPSKNMAVIGITGTNGKTTTSFLTKGMYEAMGMRIGLFGTINYYIHGDHKLEAPNTTPGALLVQNVMAKMLHNGTEAVVMEASSHGLALGRCNEVDFDIAVFTNLTRDHLDFHGTMEEYRNAKGKLFEKTINPERHRKVVNIDDPNAQFFIAKGSPEVPLVTFAVENKNAADVHPLKFKLSLNKTWVSVHTPHGVLDISSGLLGRHNIYNILATVAVGIAVRAPLEDITQGIEKVDAVPGRCEVIDEGQAFGVIVDYAHTPDAVSSLLDFVRELAPKRIITVIGCGGDRDQLKRPMMAKISTDKSEVTILTSDNPRNEDPLDILDDMLAGVGRTMQDYLKYEENNHYPPLSNGHQLFVQHIRREAIRFAIAMGEEGDMIVIAGKGHETYIIQGGKKEFFDDRQECRDALKYVDELRKCKQ